MENRDNTLTNNEVTKIYESLDSKGENTNKEALEKAHEETENTSYDNITPIESKGVGIPQVDEETLREAGLSDEYINELKSLPDVDTTVNEGENNYRDLFKEYGISDDDSVALFKIIMQYKNDGIAKGLYNKLPPTVKNLADGLIVVGKTESAKVSKDNAAKILIDSFIGDAKFSASIDEFNEEMNNLLISSTEEYKSLMNGYIESIYKDIDKIRAEDPEKAEALSKIKQAFEDAEVYAKELESFFL